MEAATSIEDLHRDVLTCALRRLDGRSLAAASCATAALRAVASDPETWRSLCLATWPSLSLIPHLLPTPRRLFADAFPFPSSEISSSGDLPGELISAVDLYHNGVPFLSRVVETSTSSTWFRGSPFRIDAVDLKDPPPAISQGMTPAEMSLSWIVVDPASRRAVNVSSRRPVAVDRHWYTGEAVVRFAVVIAEWKVEAVVTCSEETGHVREVSLGIEDCDGLAVNGEGSLVILSSAIEGKRNGGEREEEEAKRRYEEFVKRKKGRKERKARREVLVDLCCSAVSAAAVLTFFAAVVFR